MTPTTKELIQRKIQQIINSPLAKSNTNIEKTKTGLFEIIAEKLNNLNKRNNYPEKFPGNKIQVLDFFSGCGGMSLGFKLLESEISNIEVIGGMDINIDASKSFELNHNAPCLIRDINTIPSDSSSVKEFLKSYPKFDPTSELILIGCAPCQGFSSHRKKNWDKKDNRNNLIVKFAEISSLISPECIIMENVPELLSGKYWAYFEKAKKIWEKAGYKVKQKIVNTAEFGVPQERFRALIVAMKTEFRLPEPILNPTQFKTVNDAIGNLPKILPGEICKNDKFHRSVNHKKSTIEIIRKIPKNGGNRPKGVGPKCLDKIKGFSDVYGRLFWDRPSITITHYSRNPASGRFVHPEQNRGLTIREVARLQSFPDNFVFLGSTDSVYKQIGEAVPPLFSCAVATSVIIDLVFEKKNRILVDNDVCMPVSNSYSSVIAGIKTGRKNNKHEIKVY